jgi:hypothetical protein
LPTKNYVQNLLQIALTMLANDLPGMVGAENEGAAQGRLPYRPASQITWPRAAEIPSSIQYDRKTL